LLLHAAAAAQDAERVEFRVLSTSAGATVEVDRGASDGLAVGDAVLLRPRAGGEYRGRIIRVTDRTAIVELLDGGTAPPPGTRGEAFVPTDRRRPRPAPEARPGEPKPEPAPDAGRKVEHPPWTNQDRGFTPDQPLLAQVKPIHPRERAPRYGGRWFTFADLTWTRTEDLDNSLLRTGIDAWIENPFGRGGAMRFDGEIDYLTETSNKDGLDLTVRELSYAEGGTRFDPLGWQVGRFLLADVPQFGLLDGAAFSRRRDNGHRFGASIGFLPELDDDMETGEDLQIAAFYRWVDDVRETLAVTAAVQKTWHQGKSDRDLLVLDARRLPVDGWDLRASVWVDFYTGGSRDAVKGGGAEVTHAFASVGRRFDSGSGFDLAYRRLRFPALLRTTTGPQIPGEINNDRYDRLALTWWRLFGPERHRFHGQLSGFDDETTDGGALELGVDLQRTPYDDGHLDLTAFASAGRLGSHFGGRVTLGRTLPRGSFDVFYEVGNHHFDGFTADRDDLIQHRVFATRTFTFDPAWILTAHAGAHFWDEDSAWSLGFFVQRTF